MSKEEALPDNWERIRLHKLVAIDSDSLGTRTPSGYEFQYISLSDVNSGLINKNLPLIKFSDAPSRARRKIRKGDVLFSTVRPNLEGYARINGDTNNLIASTGFAVLSPRESTDTDFIYQYLYSHDIKRQIYALVVGSNYPAVNSSDVANLKLSIPKSPSERQTIADLLSTWDEAIEKTERLIKANEKKKLTELHSLISTQNANSTIGCFAKPVIRKADKPEDSYMALGIRSHFKGTFQRFVEDPKTVNMDTLYRVKENDLIVNITFAWEGAITLVKKEDERCYVSHRFPTYEINKAKAESSFIRQLIMSSRMKYDLANISPGGAGRNRVLNKKDFLKMHIWLPDIEKQKNIGEYLGEIDREIDLLKQLAEQYRKQKRGLMQKLLTGEWRVNTDKEVA